VFLDDEAGGARGKRVARSAEERRGRGFRCCSFDGRGNGPFEALTESADAANRRGRGCTAHRKAPENVSFAIGDDDRDRFAERRGGGSGLLQDRLHVS
jgi:hypothetical protein